jgi:hypothetical protein
LEELYYLLNQADVIITYNGQRFDIPKINTRLITHGYNPPNRYSHIDLYRTVKSVFAFSSGKLDFVNEQLGLGRKDKSELQWWVRAYLGDAEALLNLKEYNEQDVYILEDLYIRLRPWINNHPNLTLFSESYDSRCGICGSKSLKPIGYSITAVGKYPVHRCNDCGSLLRERRTVLSRNDNKTLLKN